MTDERFGKCPYFTAQSVLQGKWSILILHFLSDGTLRFNELLKMMPNMTHATLSKQLKKLENDSLIIRKEYPQIPPKVEYSLSNIGKEFLPVLDSFKTWGKQYIQYMEKTDH
ncbi:winged helix-turn-helix transcriptional regulator [Beduini massiliensis]|uniref:winged helix-turn-helix transcriptional regulator n=1 Tax=Beduini massiliensis TaxID=1585974 RepID=UPI00059AAF17|nr:helix-turn-helix domain-containing protein [Beduini massiliensis]